MNSSPFTENASQLTRVHCTTFYQNALRNQHKDVTLSFHLDSSKKGLILVMFCSDLPVKRCEGGHARFTALAFVLKLMQYVKVCKSG